MEPPQFIYNSTKLSSQVSSSTVFKPVTSLCVCQANLLGNPFDMITHPRSTLRTLTIAKRCFACAMISLVFFNKA